MVKWTIARSAPLGFIIGVLPGAGASIASAITYMIEKNVNDTGKTFGHGDMRGVAAPESANNAAAAGSVHPDADAGRARLRHDGGDDGRADALQHHAGPDAVHRRRNSCGG